MAPDPCSSVPHQFAEVGTKRIFRNVFALFQAFIAYICSAATFTHLEILFYRKWSCLAQVSSTCNTYMVQHLVNTQCLYPSQNIASTAAAMDEATNDTNEHYHEG